MLCVIILNAAYFAHSNIFGTQQWRGDSTNCT